MPANSTVYIANPDTDQRVPGADLGGTFPDVPINGNQDVASAATAVQLTANAKRGYLIIKAKTSNTNNIYVGDSSVAAANGYILAAGEAVAVGSDNLSEWYIDADTNGEGVTFVGAYIT